MMSEVDELPLPRRALRILRRENVFTLKQLLQLTERDILSFYSAGKKTVQAIIDILDDMGHHLSEEFSVSEAAARLKITRQAVLYHIKNDHLYARRTGSLWRIPADEVSRFQRARSEQRPANPRNPPELHSTDSG